jgi:Flp pilus assembly protein TadG
LVTLANLGKQIIDTWRIRSIALFSRFLALGKRKTLSSDANGNPFGGSRLRGNLRRRGQELLEFAIVFPVLLIFVIGAVDLARIFYTAIVVANAAREGARYAISYGIEIVDHDNNTSTPEVIVLKNSGTDIVNVVLQEAQGSGITLNNGDVTINCLPAISLPSPYNQKCSPGQPVRVTVTHPFTPIINWGTYNIRRATEMMIPFRG